MQTPESTTASGHNAAIEHWFIRRGVPHFIEGYEARTDIWTRAVPILVVAYLARGLNALDLYQWSWQANVLIGIGVVIGLVAAWAVANRLRGRPLMARPSYVGPPELAVFVLVPALPPLVVGQGGDAFQTVVEGLGVLGLVYLGTSYGVVPLVLWAGRRSASQIALLGNLVVRALPLLLLFTTFLFINAEVWQVAGVLTGVPYALTLGTFFVLGAVFVLSRVPATMHGLSVFDNWIDVREHLAGTPAEAYTLPTDGPPPAADLGVRQKLNIGLVTVFSQALQVTLVALVLSLFFVGFGFFAMHPDTQAAWTGLESVQVWVTVTVDGRELVITEQLVRVSAFLGAFTGMYFTVVLSTDATYREEFAEDVGPQVRQALAVRCAYRWANRTGDR